MHSATENATAIISTLTRTYSRVRQASITTEINEIVGGALSIGGTVMANNTVKLAVEEATKKTTAGDGRIVRIIGPVVDVKFDGAVPPIYNALTVEAETPIGHLSTILEVESQLPGGVVRTGRHVLDRRPAAWSHRHRYR